MSKPDTLRDSGLISPDDGTSLCATATGLVDQSGNVYGRINGIYDLRPKWSIEGVLRYRLMAHQQLRTFKYQATLVPLFPENQHKGTDLKESNISGFVPVPHVGAKCLDHGCGSGKMRPFVESLGYSYIGVDSEIGATAEQGGGARYAGGANYLCDLHRLPFDVNTFQFAFSYSVFEHLQNPFVAAAELYRVMKPGGICFVAVGSLVPFHMDSLYHHTHYGVLNTFQGVGFEVQQIAAANWNGYLAISDMDGLPGPKWVRLLVSKSTYLAHRLLWGLRTLVQGKNSQAEELRRRLMMSGIIKTVLRKPVADSYKNHSTA